MMSKKTRAAGLGAIGAALALTLFGCAGSAPTTSTSSADEDGGGEGELTKVTLSVNPIPQNASILLGIEQGIFAEHGLDVEIVPQPDVAAIVSGLASGQYQFGFVTVVGLINATANGVPIQAVTTVDGKQPTEEGEAEAAGLVAGPGSGIESIADLEGKTLAVVGLQSLGTVTAWELASEAGINPESIELIQLPFGQMPAALAAGDADAAVVQAPFLGQALAEGSTSLAKPNVEVFGGTSIAFYATGDQYAEQNPDVVQAFHDAVIESQEYTRDHVEEARVLLADFLGVTPEAAAALTWNNDTEFSMDTEGIAIAQGLLKTYAGLTKEVNPEEMVWPGALK
jgi:NitT/TauT family transport system substrate-binding protein